MRSSGRWLGTHTTHLKPHTRPLLSDHQAPDPHSEHVEPGGGGLGPAGGSWPQAGHLPTGISGGGCIIGRARVRKPIHACLLS